MQVVQLLLEKRWELGIHTQVCFVPLDPKLREGCTITLKDAPEKGEWKVVKMYARQDSSDINTKWGTALPKSQRTER